MDAVRREPSRELANGVRIPMLGLGVWQIPAGRETEQAVAWALEAGYRHVDTASVYGNEASVGSALERSGLPRDEVFVTTKLLPERRDAVRELEGSLQRLRLDQVDLYLVHWSSSRTDQHWQNLETLYQRGLARAIGVSNFTARDLDRLARTASVTPHVNQVHCSPFQYPRSLIETCGQHGIVFEGYSPLEEGRGVRHPAVTDIAARHARTPAQVLIRWSLQHDVIAIPKSSKRERIRENAQVFDFELDDDDMSRLDALDRSVRRTTGLR
jgi:diketogulonate reductase-like aldo/keto reductase